MKVPKKLFHVSFDKHLAGLVSPKLPDGYDGHTSELSEPKYPRISVSPSIAQCVMAVYPNISHLFEEKDYPYVDMYLYAVKTDNVNALVPPQALTAMRFVHDAHITDEYWIVENIRWTRHSKRIRVFNPKVVPSMEYHPFNDESMDKRSLGPDYTKFKIEEI